MTWRSGTSPNLPSSYSLIRPSLPVQRVVLWQVDAKDVLLVGGVATDRHLGAAHLAVCA